MSRLTVWHQVQGLVIGLVIAVGLAGEATAVPKHSPTVVTASAVLIVLDGDVGAAKIPVNRGVESYVYLPTDIRALSVKDLDMRKKFRYQTRDVRFRIYPRSGATDKDTFSALIETATVDLSVMTYAGSAEDAFKPRVVMPRAEYERMMADSESGKQSFEDAVRDRVESMRAKWEAERDEREDMLERERYRRRMHAQPMVPSTKDGCSAGPVRACIARGEWDGDELVLTLEVANTDVIPHVVTGPAVNDRAGKLFAPRLIVFDEFATDAKGEVAKVPPGGKTQVTVTVPEASAGDFRSLSLELQVPGVAKPVVAAVDKWRNNPFFEPKSKAQIEEEKREAEEKAQDRAARGRVTLHVQGMAGGIWLANPLDKESLDPTGVYGLGARVTYGFNRYVGLEADVMGASSGEAQFEGVDYNGQQGDMLRRATLGRVTLGGVVRLGVRRYIPVVRLGLGLQGASHTAEMDVGGVRMPGPEVGFEFDALWFFGGGLDIRIGDSLVVGAALSFEKSVSSSSRSLEGGVHLGYGWKP